MSTPNTFAGIRRSASVSSEYGIAELSTLFEELDGFGGHNVFGEPCKRGRVFGGDGAAIPLDIGLDVAKMSHRGTVSLRGGFAEPGVKAWHGAAGEEGVEVVGQFLGTLHDPLGEPLQGQAEGALGDAGGVGGLLFGDAAFFELLAHERVVKGRERN